MEKEREIELLGAYSDEAEEKYVTGSERGERELDVIKDSLDTLLNGEL